MRAAILILIPQLLLNQKSRVHTTTGPRLSGVARQQVLGSLRLYHSITERQRLQCKSMRRSCHSEKRSKTAISLLKIDIFIQPAFVKDIICAEQRVTLDQKTRSCTWHQVPHCVNDIRRDIQKGCDSGVANALVPFPRSSRKRLGGILWYRGEIL